MATMNKVIECVDRLNLNVYTDEDKYKWISNVDGMVSVEVFGNKEPTKYDIPEDANKELLVPHPYDDIYQFYVSAMIDLHNKEYEHYNNNVMIFRERLDQFKAYYMRNNPSCKANNFRNIMG